MDEGNPLDVYDDRCTVWSQPDETVHDKAPLLGFGPLLIVAVVLGCAGIVLLVSQAVLG